MIISPMLTSQTRQSSIVPAKNHCQRPHLTAASAWLVGAESLIDRTQPLAIGYSGGADSTALLLALAEWHPHIEAWHIDHGWHAASQHHAQILAERCHDWQIPFRCRTVQCDPGRNREASARHARMTAFRDLAKQRGIHHIALAHHRDDQAETVLMRLLQGAGVRGCCGIRSEQMLGTLHLLRPLLRQPGSALRTALKQACILWLEDPSNHDTTLLRNRLRHSLLPAMNSAMNTIPDGSNCHPATELFTRLSAQAQRLQQHIEALAQTVPITKQQAGVAVLWQKWRLQSAPIRAAILQSMARELLGASVCLGRRHIQAVEAWHQQGGRGGIDLSASRLLHKGSHLLLSKRGH
ncbi:MAG: tRNA lysidine(34) synthetase TilS [Mariprofundales bacterium]|nr:tRNA lysidine(34) synthetase TilS [Mariprofundales bacterium]